MHGEDDRVEKFVQLCKLVSIMCDNESGITVSCHIIRQKTMSQNKTATVQTRSIQNCTQTNSAPYWDIKVADVFE